MCEGRGKPGLFSAVDASILLVPVVFRDLLIAWRSCGPFVRIQFGW